MVAVENNVQFLFARWNAFFGSSYMRNSPIPVLTQALKAFICNESISVRKKDGLTIPRGHIAIMYGEVAFRIQSIPPDLDSYFVSI